MQGHHNYILNAGRQAIKAHNDYIDTGAQQFEKGTFFCVTLYFVFFNLISEVSQSLEL